jgi:hypothetical protein
MHTEFLPENLKGRDNFRVFFVAGRILLKWILKE